MQVKWSSILIWILIAVAVIMALYLLRWPDFIYNGVNWVFAKINTINLGDIPAQIGNYFTNDPVKGLTTIISVAGALGTIYGLYNTWKKTQLNNQLQNQVLEAQINANSQVNQIQTQAQQEASKYQSQITGYQNQISQYTDIKSQLSQATSSVQTLESQLSQKQATIEELSRLLEQLKLKTYETIVVK